MSAEFEFTLKTSDGIRSGSHSGGDSLQHWQFTDFVDDVIEKQKDIKIYCIDLSVDMDTECNQLWRDNELSIITEHMRKNMDNYKHLEEIIIWCNPASVADETLESLGLFIKQSHNLKSVTINGPQTDVYDEEMIRTVILSGHNRLFHVDIDGIGLCYDIETKMDELPKLFDIENTELVERRNDNDIKQEMDMDDMNVIPCLLYQKAYRLNGYYKDIDYVMQEMDILPNDVINFIVNQLLKAEITISIDCTSLSCLWEPENEWTSYAKYLDQKEDDIQVKYDDEEYKLQIMF